MRAYPKFVGGVYLTLTIMLGISALASTLRQHEQTSVALQAREATLRAQSLSTDVQALKH